MLISQPITSLQDVDSYIHRAGRTGRAGRAGICVCFYKPREDNALYWVEQKAVSENVVSFF
jgi:superfamily II DNA/RNA helicase